MALIEVVDDFFVGVVNDLAELTKHEKDALLVLTDIYEKNIGRADNAKSNLTMIDSYSNFIDENFAANIDAFLKSKDFIFERIKLHSVEKHLFRQPSILFVYMLVNKSPSKAKGLWEYLPEELRIVYTDMGMNFDKF